ncbi:MAG: hypothetical protein HZA94_01130 [Candidatus Vogelbacteria bacterium]|nr:hypothetical protein [Candidatus Vogelbacteria bacterium]
MKTVAEKIFVFFDKLEDHVRGRLSHHPVAYSLIGGIALVTFWYGVDIVIGSVPFFNTFLGGVVLVVVSLTVLLMIGVLVSFFVGDTVIISGLKHEKKEIEKTEEEIKEEDLEVHTALKKINHIEKLLEGLESKQNSCVQKEKN